MTQAYVAKSTIAPLNIPAIIKKMDCSQKYGEDLQNFVAFSEYMNFKQQLNLKLKDFKGQLIWKCPFGVIIWTKIPTKSFQGFLP